MKYDTLIIGAGAAGMMCAAHAKGRVLLVDHAKAPGEKIRISGGGRCNFTNLHAAPKNFLSQNKHFCKSALGRYAQWDFIEMVEKHHIAYHEKTLGQLFCDDSAKQIVTMLRDEMDRAKAELRLCCSVADLRKMDTSPVWQHMGLYAYTIEALDWFVGNSPGTYEILEGLEQLRFLEHGWKIATVPVAPPEHALSGIDTAADLALAEEAIAKLGDPFPA